ncbi:MAG TPA: hypothetical protein VNO30_25380 [Kofleriaceae bacterium]|nr:hypothetical protein [Kofleriaceae bacterium]
MKVRWLLLLVTAAAAACASGRAGDGPGPGGGQHDAPPGSPKDSATTSVDAKPGTKLDAAMMIDAPGGGGGGGLDPDLEIPDPSGQVCDEPGRMSGECPAGEVCRFYTSTEGRCEGCTACGNLGASCTATDQCDILFECYKGQCTNFCTLNSTECGAPTDCINIGHATRGVCRV